jgi:hypothetical protein
MREVRGKRSIKKKKRKKKAAQLTLIEKEREGPRLDRVLGALRRSLFHLTIPSREMVAPYHRGFARK